jgi:hypothetical protein
MAYTADNAGELVIEPHDAPAPVPAEDLDLTVSG